MPMPIRLVKKPDLPNSPRLLRAEKENVRTSTMTRAVRTMTSVDVETRRQRAFHGPIKWKRKKPDCFGRRRRRGRRLS